MMARTRVPNPPPNPSPTQKSGCPTPAQPPAQHTPNPRPTGGAQPHPPKGGFYSVPPKGERHTPVQVSTEIEALAERVQRLMVSHRDPERFFVERSDIAHEMRRLARGRL